MKRTGIRRKMPLPRATQPLARTTRGKATNPRRKREAFARAYGSRGRVAFVKAFPCVVCVKRYPKMWGDSDNAHVPSKSGAGRKGDARRIVPLCRWHHTGSAFTSLHALGKSKFNAYHGLDLDAEAARVDALFTESDQ